MATPTYKPWNAPINVQPLSEKEMRDKYADKVRKGKTKKDRAKSTRGE